MGEPLKLASMPYDWTMLPPAALVSWLQSGEQFPASPGDIVQHPNFYWPRHGLHFWHEFTVDGAPALVDQFNFTRAKFAHLFANFRRACNLERRIFVVSNTQNNLDTVRAVSPGLDFKFTGEAIQAIAATIDAVAPGNNEFVFVTHIGGATPDAFDAGHELHVMEPRLTEVFGHDGDWLKLFRHVVPPVSRTQLRRDDLATSAGADLVVA